MAITETLKNLEKRYAWSVLSVLLAIIFGGLSYYLGFIKEEKPDLNYRIISNARVFEIREQLQDISLQYDGIDILEADKSLSIVVFEAVNQGNESILNNYYDPSSPLGFRIVKGSLLNVELINASNNYLKNNLNIKSDSTHVSFSPVIIDPQENFIIKSLILHPSDSSPKIEATGKVAKHDIIDVIENDNNLEIGFFQSLLSGSIWVHIARFFFYFFLLLFTSITLVVLIILPSEKITERKRKKNIKRFRKRGNNELEGLENIFEYYIEKGSTRLLMYNLLVSDEEKLSTLYKIYSLQGKLDSAKSDLEILKDMTPSIKSFPVDEIKFTKSSISDMKDLGIIKELENDFVANENIQEEFEEFIKYLKILDE